MWFVQNGGGKGPEECLVACRPDPHRMRSAVLRPAQSSDAWKARAMDAGAQDGLAILRDTVRPSTCLIGPLCILWLRVPDRMQAGRSHECVGGATNFGASGSRPQAQFRVLQRSNEVLTASTGDADGARKTQTQDHRGAATPRRCVGDHRCGLTL